MKVLVVDDSKAICMLVKVCVQSLGHEVTFSETGEAAIEYIKDNVIDLVLMDVEMPGMNGFETTHKIRSMNEHDWFPIIFLTTKQDEDSFANGILAAGDAYLAKPINPQRLQLTITAMERIYHMREKLHLTQKHLLKANKELKRLALYDPLTGIANRRNFDESLQRQFRLAKRQKNPLSLIICDIDFFKLYNDRYGHQKGDQCLTEVAKVIASVPDRPTDKTCRYGGEEFTIILPGTHLQGGLLIAEKIRKSVFDNNIKHEGSPIASWITLSLGLATYTNQIKNQDENLKSADDALYNAKENGRNRVEIGK